MGVKDLSDKVKSKVHRLTHPDLDTVMEAWKQWLTGTKAELYEFRQRTKEEDKKYEEFLGYWLAEGTIGVPFVGSAYLAQKYPQLNPLVGATLLFFCLDAGGKIALNPQSAIGMIREALGKGKKWSDLEEEWVENTRTEKHDELMETYELFDEAYLDFFTAPYFDYMESGQAREDFKADVESIRNGVLVRAREYLGMVLAEDVPDTKLSEVVSMEEYVHWTMRVGREYSHKWWERSSHIELQHDLIIWAMKEGMERFDALKEELENARYDAVAVDDTEQPEESLE